MNKAWIFRQSRLVGRKGAEMEQAQDWDTSTLTRIDTDILSNQLSE